MIYYWSVKKNEILSVVTTWMDPEGIMPSKICKEERDRYFMISHDFTCMWNLENQTNEQNKTQKKQTQT